MQNFPNDILTDIKAHLVSEKERVASRIAALTVQDPFTHPDRTIDNAASDMEASEESDHDRMQALLAELTQERADIDGALGRIEDGSYGFCSVCHAMIDTDRLAILPTATLCLTHEKAASKHK